MNAKIIQFDDTYSLKSDAFAPMFFIEEQGIDPILDFDGLDNIAIQALGHL